MHHLSKPLSSQHLVSILPLRCPSKHTYIHKYIHNFVFNQRCMLYFHLPLLTLTLLSVLLLQAHLTDHIPSIRNHSPTCLARLPTYVHLQTAMPFVAPFPLLSLWCHFFLECIFTSFHSLSKTPFPLTAVGVSSIKA